VKSPSFLSLSSSSLLTTNAYTKNTHTHTHIERGHHSLQHGTDYSKLAARVAGDEFLELGKVTTNDLSADLPLLVVEME
jgi:hypothetical protein